MGNIKSEFLASSRESSLSALADGIHDVVGEELPFDIQFVTDERPAGEMNEAEGFTGAAALTS